MKCISVHYPKAGGSSLRVQFEWLLGPALLLDYGNDPLGSNGRLSVNSLPPEIRMVHGHFKAARYKNVPDAFRFTFLREPVENLLSIFFFGPIFLTRAFTPGIQNFYVKDHPY
jgi:hypothetical protein